MLFHLAQDTVVTVTSRFRVQAHSLKYFLANHAQSVAVYNAALAAKQATLKKGQARGSAFGTLLKTLAPAGSPSPAPVAGPDAQPPSKDNSQVSTPGDEKDNSATVAV